MVSLLYNPMQTELFPVAVVPATPKVKRAKRAVFTPVDNTGELIRWVPLFGEVVVAPVAGFYLPFNLKRKG